MELLERVAAELEKAQNELVSAETDLLELKGRAEKARNDVLRLETALKALKGEVVGENPGQNAKKSEETTKKRRKQRKSNENDPYAPYAELACTGCGEKGTMQAQLVTNSSGGVVQTLTCRRCGNMSLR